MVGVGPFQKFDLSHQLRFNPNTFLHLVGGHTFAPARAMLFGKIDKRTFRNHKRLQFLEQLTPTRWHKTVSGSCDVNQFFAPIVANDYGVQAVQSRRIAADDELLSSIDTVFNSSSAA